MEYEVAVGDIVTLRKPHACGANEWRVRRIGADIGLNCQGCGRRIMITRREYFRRVKKVLSAGQPEDAAEAADEFELFP